MWIDDNSAAYFQEQVDRNGAVVLESIPFAEQRFITETRSNSTNLLVVRTTTGNYAPLVPQDLTPRQADLAHYFADQENHQGWRILAVPACATVSDALLYAGRVLGVEPDAPINEAITPPQLPTNQNERPEPRQRTIVRVPAQGEAEATQASSQPTAFTRDLTDLARRGQLMPVHGRDKELDEVLTVLMQRARNCPLLVGEPGVGKTAVAEKLALQADRGALPAPLREMRVLSLDLPALIAASGQKGAMERNTKELLDSLAANPKWLLFVDEIHSLADARGDISLFDILKPCLTEGLRIIGATTHKEYQQRVAADAALARRFTPVRVEEPESGETEAILRERLPRLRDHHRIEVSDDLIGEIVRLADEYFPDRRRPDKALTLLDRAMAAEALKGYRQPE